MFEMIGRQRMIARGKRRSVLVRQLLGMKANRQSVAARSLEQPFNLFRRKSDAFAEAVDRVRQATELKDPDGATFSAPDGIRFIVIDATITNLTGTAQKFEPDNLTIAGRETALWLFDENEKIVSYRGRDGDDYSTQYNTVVGSLQTPLSGVTLFPHIPYSGQLVFHYPVATLDADHRAVLEVHELGRGFRYARSLGGVRLHL